MNAPPSPPREIVLIPGFMCDASLWQAILPALETHGKLHLVDLNQGSSIEAMAEYLLPNLPARCTLIGFSLGGYVAQRIARLVPQRIDNLVLLNTSARASTAEEIARNRQQIKLCEAFPFKGQTKAAFQRALHPERKDKPDLLAHLQAMSLALGKQVFMRQLSIIRADGHADLAHISCPSLVVASRNDQMRSLQEAENLVAGLPRGRLSIIENCGHMSPLEQPLALLDLLTQYLAESEKNLPS